MARQRPVRRQAAQPTGTIAVLPVVGGKIVHVQVRKIGEPEITEQRRLAAHEHMTVQRT